MAKLGLSDDDGPPMRVALQAGASVFELELVKRLGPEEAHWVLYSPEMCADQSSWGAGPGK